MKLSPLIPVDNEQDALLRIIAHRNSEGPLPGLWLLSLCLAVTYMAGCQEPSSTVTAQAAGGVQIKAMKPEADEVSGGQPKIMVEKDVCDLGEIGIDTKHTGQFKFTNTGNAPLKIILVQTCCGVAVKGVEAGQEYAPGWSGTLEFDYPGSFHAQSGGQSSASPANERSRARHNHVDYQGGRRAPGGLQAGEPEADPETTERRLP